MLQVAFYFYTYSFSDDERAQTSSMAADSNGDDFNGILNKPQGGFELRLIFLVKMSCLLLKLKYFFYAD